jgi:PKD repeat protein
MGQNPSHAYGTAGAFDATLTVTNAVGSDSITRRVLVAVGPERAPTADFTYSPAGGGITGEPVQFTDLSTDAPADWLWEFGDGSTSIARNPSHVFAGPGTYLVKLTVTNSKGSNSKQTRDRDGGRAPRGLHVFAASPLVGQTVVFTDTSTDAPTSGSGFGTAARPPDGRPTRSRTGFHTVTSRRETSGENTVSRSVSVSQGTLPPIDLSRQARIGERRRSPTSRQVDPISGSGRSATGSSARATRLTPTRAGLFTVALTFPIRAAVAEHTVAVIDKASRGSRTARLPRASDAITFRTSGEPAHGRYWDIGGVPSRADVLLHGHRRRHRRPSARRERGGMTPTA